MSRLLLIDDDQELCELLASWLTQEGFQVTACHEAGSARQALRVNSWARSNPRFGRRGLGAGSGIRKSW